MIVSGASEGLLLLAQSLASRFHSIYIEDPTIDITRDIFQMMNYRLVPIEVDHSGMRIDSLASFAPGHLVLLTPSHQFPSGSVLSIQRRHQVIRMLEEADSFVIEDDYDSEFRLRGIPVPPLQTLAFESHLRGNIQQNLNAEPPDRLHDRAAGSNRCHNRDER